MVKSHISVHIHISVHLSNIRTAAEKVATGKVMSNLCL